MFFGKKKKINNMLNTGQLYFIIEEENDENSILIKEFESHLKIDKKLLIQFQVLKIPKIKYNLSLIIKMI